MQLRPDRFVVLPKLDYWCRGFALNTKIYMIDINLLTSPQKWGLFCV
jgi:hypothetical protein